jgi:hypothetical protein
LASMWCLHKFSVPACSLNDLACVRCLVRSGLVNLKNNKIGKIGISDGNRDRSYGKILPNCKCEFSSKEIHQCRTRESSIDPQQKVRYPRINMLNDPAATGGGILKFLPAIVLSIEIFLIGCLQLLVGGLLGWFFSARLRCYFRSGIFFSAGIPVDSGQ